MKIPPTNGRPFSGQCYPERSALKKVIAPDSKRQAVRQAVEALDVSERKACEVIGQPR